ncbi:MAG: phosphatase PAP2 family protein [Actinobacteria bacterium]|nr:phosphatase PAP2 family protein [Actinomycetota bacterium]MSW42765.1 phosphatase PAP2 family protein [Actinomycetota bacterium]
MAWSYLTRRRQILATVSVVLAVMLVSLDRLVVGAHWLTDVAGSLALAVIIVAITMGVH